MADTLDPEDPRVLAMHRKRIIQRDIDQLLGICEFALLDGHIDQGEAEAIYEWLRNHRACLDTWPASTLYDRLCAMLADNHLDEDEQRDLLGLVMQIARPRTEEGLMAPTTLPLDDPAPNIIVPDREFCFTGVFSFGSRRECTDAVIRLGGIPANGVTKRLDYLVIGSIGSEAWRHTSFGTKILKAVEYRDGGQPLAIITEEHWVRTIG